MCGIAGISLSPNDKKMNIRQVASDLLYGIASRGPDATGASWYDHTEDAVKLTKIAVNTPKFLAARKEVLPETTPVMILHTRMATTGSKSERGNNHPIHHGNIIGVHNGVLWGHEEMFKEMGRKPFAEVDSEAIFALLNGGVRPEKVLNKVAGDAAIAWIDLTDPEVLHLARVVDRPLFIAQTEEGSLLFASTSLAIKEAVKRSGLKIEFEKEVEEGKYLKVVGGVIAEYLDIPGIKRNEAWSKKYAYTSGSDYDWSAAHTATPAGQTAGDTCTPAKAVAAKKADPAPASGGIPLTNWLSGKSTKELVRLATAGGHGATAELAARGLDESGDVVFLLSTNELVTLVRTTTGGHRWAERQLAYRKRTPTGQPVTESILIDTDELVVLAAGGSDLAAEALLAQGLDRVGNPLALTSAAK